MKISISILIILSIFVTTNPPISPRAYIFSNQITERFRNDTNPSEYFYASWEFSFIQEYQKALWAFDQVSNSYPSLTEEQKKHFLSFKPVNALNYIIQQSTDEKVIIINEAHHQPLHRTFTTSLLEGLYKNGYRYLGLEALSFGDSLLNERGYPITNTGFYTQESQFGNLVRTALSLGYTLFPYDSKTGANGKEREIEQARNIEEVIHKNPDGKFLIHCGFGHLVESDVPNWGKAMAGRLKEFTGIDPFTINQDILTEHYLKNKENPYYLLVDTLKESSVFINENNEVFHGGKGDNRFDVRLFHPRTKFINGRPDWLYMNGERKSYILKNDSINIEFPIMVKAYYNHENDNAVPVDVIEIKDYSDQKALVLPSGSIELLIEDIKGDSIKKNIIIE